MQPPLNPYGDEGVGRLQLTQKAEAICVDLHTSAVHRFFRIKRIWKELCLEPAESPSFLPTCFASQKTQPGAFCVTGLCSGSQWKPPWGTHTQELRARQTPFVNLKEIATERVRLQEILPFPQTRRHGACLPRLWWTLVLP